MSNLQEAAVWHEGIHQHEPDEPITGGPEGLDNLPHKQLADRMQWLKERITSDGMPAHLAAPHPHQQYLLRSEAGGSFVAPANVVAKSGDTMTGPLALSGFPTLDMHAVPRAYIDSVMPKEVRRPVNTTPANNAVSFSVSGTLVATAFYSMYGITHAQAQFQVSTQPDFSTLTFDWTGTAATSKAISPALVAGTIYFWRCRYKDSNEFWSDWSIPTRFSTGTALVAAPSITSPSSGATGVTRQPTLTSSAFAMTSGSDTQSTGRFQIAADPYFVNIVEDSGNSATSKTSYTVQTALNYGVTYYARCLHNGASYGSSGWSAAVAFTVVAGSASAPTLVSPLANAVGVSRTPTLVSTAFSAQGLNDTQASARWQLSTDSNFSTLYHDSGNSTTAKTSYTLPVPLSFGQIYYARCQHTGQNYGSSSWSPTVAFTVVAGEVLTPNIMSPANEATGVLNTPTLTASPFSCDGTPDTQAAADWEIRSAANGGGQLIFASTGDTNNKTSIKIPEGFLEVNKTYYVRVRYKGTAYGYGGWAESSFSTALSFVPTVPGTPYAGGYYVDRLNIGGNEFALIIAPKSSGQSIKYGGWSENLSLSLNNGLSNSNSASTGALAIQFCLGLVIGGYSDWYLPAIDELERCYRKLKPNATANDTSSGYNASAVSDGAAYTLESPTQTLSAEFQVGGSEAFDLAPYWSSSFLTGQTAGKERWLSFSNGYQGTYGGEQEINLRCRAMRRVLIAPGV